MMIGDCERLDGEMGGDLIILQSSARPPPSPISGSAQEKHWRNVSIWQKQMTKIHLKYYKNSKCDVSNLFSTLVICLVLFTCRGRGSKINWWQILRRWQLWWEFPGLTIPQVGGQAITWDGQLAPTIPFHCSPFTVHHSASQCITVHHSASQWNDILYDMHKIQRLLQQCECESFDAPLPKALLHPNVASACITSSL